MNKLCCLLLLGIVFPVQSGFIKDTPSVMNVADVKEMSDDVPVLLQGHIIQQLDDENYLFKDETDEIVVEIDKKAWNKVDVRSSDIIQLKGTVDKDFSEDIKIEVDQVIPIKQNQENSK